MKEEKVYMDAGVFTEIVGSIGNSAADCVLSDSVLENIEVWENTSVGKKMEKLLRDVLNSSKVYREESSVVLPTAYLKLRDSMRRVDDVASKSIKVDSAKE